MRWGIVVVAGLLAVAGCSGGEAAADSPAPSTAVSAPAPAASTQAVETKASVDFTDAESIIAALNAGGFACTAARQRKEVIGAKSDWRCTHAATEDVSVTVFESPEQYQEFLRNFGSLINPDISVAGDAWSVFAPSKADVPAVKAALGV